MGRCVHNAACERAERGCVEDQPQHLGTGYALRLVEDDTAALRFTDFGLAKLRSADAHIRAKGTPGGELADVGIRAPDAEASTVVQSAAESTEPGRVMGTPSYMAPEQVRGESVDHRADLFAFGCVLYEMASGKRRRKLRSPQPVLRHLLSLPRRAPRPPPTRNPSPCCRLST